MLNSLARVAIPVFCWAFIVFPALGQQPNPVPIPYPNWMLDHNLDGSIDSKDLLILLQGWGLKGITTPTPDPTSTRTPTPISLPTETLTPTPSPTRTVTPTSTQTNTATATPTETPTVTDTPTQTETPTQLGAFTVELPDLPPPLPLRLVRIPAGSFMMGSPNTERSRGTDEGPQHQVTIDYDFFMGQTEVTQSQWMAVMGTDPSNYLRKGKNYPVNNISWEACQTFLQALNTISEEGTFRLPSEAEWEYACRAGTTSRFYFGNSLGCSDECANCAGEEIVIGLPQSASDGDSKLSYQLGLKGLPFQYTRADFMWFCWNTLDLELVKSLRPNNFGLFDMSGNVGEFCQDRYHPDYNGAPTDGSAWDTDYNGTIVIRGGGHFDHAALCRSAARMSAQTLTTAGFYGFRLVWTP